MTTELAITLMEENTALKQRIHQLLHTNQVQRNTMLEEVKQLRAYTEKLEAVVEAARHFDQSRRADGWILRETFDNLWNALSALDEVEEVPNEQN